MRVPSTSVLQSHEQYPRTANTERSANKLIFAHCRRASFTWRLIPQNSSQTGGTVGVTDSDRFLRLQLRTFNLSDGVPRPLQNADAPRASACQSLLPARLFAQKAWARFVSGVMSVTVRLACILSFCDLCGLTWPGGLADASAIACCHKACKLNCVAGILWAN